jgi:hypothetical protein
LAPEGHYLRLSIAVELATHVGQRKEGTAVDAGLTVDVDDAIWTRTQKALERFLKERIPIQNVVDRGVQRPETDVAGRADVFEPGGTILGEGTVDDVGNPVLADKGRSQHCSRPNENAGMEVGRRLAKIVWNGSQHLLFHGELRFNGHTRELPLRQLRTIQR